MMRKGLLCLLLAGCTASGIFALDLQLRDGTCLSDIQFVRPAWQGVTLTAVNQYGQRYPVTVPFTSISLPSLYSLRSYLMRNRLPAWDSPYMHPPAWSASIAALDLYLRRFFRPSVILSGNTLFLRLGAPGSWRDAVAPCPATVMPSEYPQPVQ